MKEIKKRWPRITYLLSGWSGAGYFPNQIRYIGKDNVKIGKLREQYFANNFFRFTYELSPQVAVPFVPGFVLLKKNNRWINHVKFPRAKVNEYYNKYYPPAGKTKFIVAYPGDSIENGNLNAAAVWHHIEEKEHYDYAYVHYKKEIENADTIDYANHDEIDELTRLLNLWMNRNQILYHKDVLRDSIFSIKAEDTHEEVFMNISYDGEKFEVTKSATALPERRLLISAPVKQLLHALKREWGGDVLTIGYGLTVEIYDERSLEKNLDIVCVRLITRYPIARKDILKNPLRAINFYAFNPTLTSLWIKQKIMLKPYVNKYPFNERDHWLTYSQCDLCAVCKMPVINAEDYS